MPGVPPSPRDVMPLAPENPPPRIPPEASKLEPALLCYYITLYFFSIIFI